MSSNFTLPLEQHKPLRSYLQFRAEQNWQTVIEFSKKTTDCLFFNQLLNHSALQNNICSTIKYCRPDHQYLTFVPYELQTFFWLHVELDQCMNFV